MQELAKKAGDNIMIKREKYLQEIINKKRNGLVKVITGLRRCGKSYLLFTLFKNHLQENNILEKQVITFAFDNMEDIIKLDKYYPDEETMIFDSKKKNYKINSKKFIKYIDDLTGEAIDYYILLDEIQLLDKFVFVLNGLLRHNNFDIYVTGSNSYMLSSDIITEFRGRGDQIRVNPLSFKEFFDYKNIPFNDAYEEYQYFGGMPLVVLNNNDVEKKEYLKSLFNEIYIKDIVDRNDIQNIDSFETLLKILSSSIGSYTNPTNIENRFKSELKVSYHHDTIKKHIDFIEDSFLIREANKYDVKGKKYIGANSKYYFTDLGLRNALINFRQDEPTHIMENIIYNELINRGFSVDVGVIEISEKNEKGNYVRKQLETDFICNKVERKIYIQSVYSISNIDKLNQEKKSLVNINDNYKKIIVVNDTIKNYVTEEGIEVVSLKSFLLDDII